MVQHFYIKFGYLSYNILF